MDSAFLVAIVGGGFVFFGGIALVMWIDSKGKAHERELAHAERLKALETGQTLPDAEVARARAESSRAWAAALTAILVALGMTGAAVGSTAMVFRHTDPAKHLPLVAVVWGVCGLVSLVTVILGLVMVRAREKARAKETPPNNAAKHPNAEAIRAADVPGLSMG
jgi:hypothetical protein